VNKYNVKTPDTYHQEVRTFLRDWWQRTTSKRDWYTTLRDVWVEQGLDSPKGMVVQAEWALTWDPTTTKAQLPREVMDKESVFMDVLGRWAQLRMDPTVEMDLAYKTYEVKLSANNTAADRADLVQGLMVFASQIMDQHQKSDLSTMNVMGAVLGLVKCPRQKAGLGKLVEVVVPGANRTCGWDEAMASLTKLRMALANAPGHMALAMRYTEKDLQRFLASDDYQVQEETPEETPRTRHEKEKRGGGDGDKGSGPQGGSPRSIYPNQACRFHGDDHTNRECEEQQSPCERRKHGFHTEGECKDGPEDGPEESEGETLEKSEEGEPEHDKAPLGHEVKQFRCFHCDEPGHTIRDCRAPGAQQARRDRRRGVTLEARSWKVEDATHKLVGGEGQ